MFLIRWGAFRGQHAPKQTHLSIAFLFSSSNHSRGFMDFDPRVDYYKILGVTAKATDLEIKRAFYALAKKYHPDAAA